MSERGSFVTEFIYCADCRRALHKVFDDIRETKYFEPIYFGDPEAPTLITGRIGSLSRDGEIIDFEHDYAPRIAASVCHPVRFAILADSGRSYAVKVHPEADEQPLIFMCGRGKAD